MKPQTVGGGIVWCRPKATGEVTMVARMARKLPRGDNQFVTEWGLARQRDGRRQLDEGESWVQLQEGKHYLVITNTRRANNGSHIHLKVTSDGKGSGRADV